ncbi:hypothetical protein [Streptomyces sp. NPDC054797]
MTPTGDVTTGDGIDIAPLAELPELEQVLIQGDREHVRGAELLPPSVRLRCE